MKCQYGGCKCEAKMILSTLWGKTDGTLNVCDNHTPDWAKGKAQGTLSPVKSLFGITKSFYQINSIL